MIAMQTCLASTSFGQLRGERLAEVQAYRGIPYAQAQRWRPPQPPPAWSGIRDAVRFGAIAPQAMSAGALQRFGASMAEDCLSLNIWTPMADSQKIAGSGFGRREAMTRRATAREGRSQKRPVLVFIHGGGLVSGFGSAPMLDGAALAARGDAVVVTLNYRLGIFGSLYAPAVFGSDSVNLALQDQMAALRWLRREVAAFGGDPGNITLIGQSSGAVCGACLLASPQARGLFDRAILQSGGLERVIAAPDAAAVADRLFALIGTDAASLLRQLPTDRLMAAQAAILDTMEFVPPRGEFHPTIDGGILPEHPLRAARNARTHSVPVLLGSTAHEWRAFDAGFPDEHFTAALLRERTAKLLGSERDIDAVLQIYRDEYGDTDHIEHRRAIAAALVGDFHFSAPTASFAHDHAAAGNPVFRYVLEWPSPKPGLGACHNICLPLLFGTLAAAPTLAGNDSAARRMSQILQDAWLAFARGNDPSTAALGAWPAYRPATRLSMVLDGESHSVGDHRGGALSCWERSYPALC